MTDKSGSGSEKRIYRRLKTPAKISYQLRRSDMEEKVATLKDLGGGGIQVSLAEKLELGKIIDLDIEISDLPRPVHVIGKVVWVSEVSISGPKPAVYYETGIKFIKADPVQLGKLYSHFEPDLF
ncbi:MAG: PilZ domain-containing protein [Candidatus Omnitrophica bacterium]|nr:PilZ domain-containing protein [Candidatus Omnitrophota bacterium]